MAETTPATAPVKRGPGRPRKVQPEFPPAKPVENGAVEPITETVNAMPEIAIGDFAIVTDEIGTDIGSVTFVAKSAKHHIIIVKVG